MTEPLNLGPILGRQAYYQAHRSNRPCPAHPTADDVPALVDEIKRLRTANREALRVLDRGPQMVNDHVQQHWSVPAMQAAEILRVASIQEG